MIALTTPAPVYWLLDAIQLLGVLGIIGGLWFLGTQAAGPVRTHRIRRQLAKPARSQRGAGQIETFLAWTVLVGICLTSWVFLVYGLVSLAKAGR